MSKKPRKSQDQVYVTLGRGSGGWRGGEGGILVGRPEQKKLNKLVDGLEFIPLAIDCQSQKNYTFSKKNS